MAELLPPIRQRFFNSNGTPLNGGKLYSYEAGTSTPKTTYIDRAGVTANANPTILDADGYADIWIGSGYYKFVLKDSSDVTIWTKDNVAIPNEAALASAFWRDVVYITNADSPYTITSSHNGKLINIDTTSGSVTITLPEISAVTLPYNVGFKKKVAGNTVTINRSGTDTIDGATSKTLETANAACQMIADIDKAPDDWSSLDLGTVADGSVTTAKLADSNVTRGKLAAGTGGAKPSITASKTSAYTVTSSDDLVLCDTTSAAFTVTLPAVASSSGMAVKIIKTSNDFNVLTIDGNASETIDGVVSIKLNVQWESAELYCNGSAWFIVNRKDSSKWVAYTPTFTGFGTVVTSNFRYRKIGANVEIDGTFLVATPTAVEARISLPSGLTSLSGIPTISHAGSIVRSVAAATTYYTAKEASTTYVVVLSQGDAGLTKMNGNNFSSGNTLSVSATVQIASWDV